MKKIAIAIFCVLVTLAAAQSAQAQFMPPAERQMYGDLLGPKKKTSTRTNNSASARTVETSGLLQILHNMNAVALKVGAIGAKAAKKTLKNQPSTKKAETYIVYNMPENRTIEQPFPFDYLDGEGYVHRVDDEYPFHYWGPEGFIKAKNKEEALKKAQELREEAAKTYTLHFVNNEGELRITNAPKPFKYLDGEGYVHRVDAKYPFHYHGPEGHIEAASKEEGLKKMQKLRDEAKAK